jgi:hypothetical protein
MPWSIKNLMFHDKPVPLSNQRNLGYKNVWVYCSNPDCRHSAVLNVDHLGAEAPCELMKGPRRCAME